MSILQWLSLAGVCLLGAISPGPSLVVIAHASLRAGKGVGLIAAWSHAAGVTLFALATVAGISAFLAEFPALFGALQLAGAAYLIYLAAKLLRSDGMVLNLPTGEQSAGLAASRDGFSVAFLNPKLALFMLALFSQFVQSGYGAPELAIMVATAGLIDGAWYSLIALLLTRPRTLDLLSARARLIDRLFGAVLLALALFIVIEVFLD